MSNLFTEATRNHAIKIYNDACKKQNLLKSNFTSNNFNKVNTLSTAILHQGDNLVAANTNSFPKALNNARAVLLKADKVSKDNLEGKADPVTTMIALNNAQIAATEFTACASKLASSLNTVLHMQL